MTLGVKVSGAWKNVAAPSVKVSGVWKPVKKAWVKVSGVWQLVFEDALTYTVSSDTANLNLFTALGSPAAPVNVVLTNNANIYATSTATAGLVISGFATGSVITFINNGGVYGKGGNGGAGGYGTTGSAGLAGGPAMSLGNDVTIDNTNGWFYGGGGGGGGGSATSNGGYSSGDGGFVCGYNCRGAGTGSGGGGGGGRSFSNSTGGTPATGATIGGAGTSSAAGSGGAGLNRSGQFQDAARDPEGGGCLGWSCYSVTGYGYAGRAGGTWGTAGAAASNSGAPGAAGKAIALNGKTITWTAGNARVSGAVS